MWLVDEILEKAPSVAPPAVVSGLSLFGVALQDWVYILTIIYIVMQIGKSLFNWFRGDKDG